MKLFTRRRALPSIAVILPFRAPSPPEPTTTSKVSFGDRYYRMEVYSPEAWGSIPERARPEATEMSRLGWYCGLVKLGPTEATS